MIFKLETYLLFSKGFTSFFWLIVVEIDKKIRFQKILSLEYMMKMKKYSNTEYLVKSWIMIIIGLVGLFVSFFQTIYNAFNIGTNTVGSDIFVLNDLLTLCLGSCCLAISYHSCVAKLSSCPHNIYL